ncbi:TetR/AcrR family transcriptional regulator [Antrihabitans stalactiti]|uniref:TetR/AcrR family transcriptional regulator n=1 Tax=Antrihabitans stalactiti TaxID=2584121 RepID=A0A848K4Q5_9NOCA|nr:TetR/AcrR family transcriptional regulator [Antrihabitans stalactiti]NMN93683.1 TetR/AcrR family transcriptional regulator [Antrihabitans stalactiti]
MSGDTRTRLLEAARSCLLADGYAALSTRKVADIAGVPLSQIHYHFGGKQGLVLSLLDYENRRRVDRQRQLYSADAPLWKRYEQACDLLEEDLSSGYVRVLQEMIAAGWSDTDLANQVLAMLRSWFDVLRDVADEAETRFGSLGPFAAADFAGLIGLAFLGGEAVILLGEPEWGQQVRGWLRSVGELIRRFEESAG